MSDPVQALLQGTTAQTLFASNSRYYDTEATTLTKADGTMVAYLLRRFVPPPEDFALLYEYTIVQGDRLDNLAAKHIGDAEKFWQLCDANTAIRPEELTETVGRILRITLPEGIESNA
jgi:hypothetical protein